MRVQGFTLAIGAGLLIAGATGGIAGLLAGGVFAASFAAAVLCVERQTRRDRAEMEELAKKL